MRAAAAKKMMLLDMIPGSVPEIGLGWTLDASAVIYAETQLGANLSRQPNDGGEPVKITNFSSEFIQDFALSRDGKRLALARGHATVDVVLIKDFR